MKKIKSVLTVLLIWTLISLSAQTCGTLPSTNPTVYPQENENLLTKGSSSALCINVFFHIVKNTDGSNAFNSPNTNKIIKKLNEAFSQHNITFNNLGTDFINNTNFVELSISEAETLENINNRSDAINYYIVNGLWDNFAGVVINGLPNRNLFIEEDNVYDSTSPHEVGHCLNLYHTFETKFGVERTDGSYCSIKGDLVCDTPADNKSGAINGYNPDMTNIMSYYHLSPFFLHS